ncbi:hypothetical protein [Mucilaginibacter sp. HD30]
MSDFILSLTSGVIGGLIVLLFQKFWDFNDKKKQIVEDELKAKRQLVVSPQQHLRYVESRIVEHLLPGTSMDKVKTILGVADYTNFSHVMTELSEEATLTNTHYFKFRNADILVTSIDNRSIDSTTISSHQVSEYPIEYLFDGVPNNIMGQMTFDEENAMYVEAHESNKTMRDAYFAIELYYGRGGQYRYYTLFGNDFDKVNLHIEDKDISHFAGCEINSYCISSIAHFAPYISPFS